MRYAIYHTFDQGTEARIQALRILLCDSVSGMADIRRKMRPHLTLLVFDKEDSNDLVISFQQAAEAMRCFELQMPGIGAFTGRNNVLFITPEHSEMLQEHYLSCRKAFEHAEIVKQYREKTSWKPHITLAKGMDSSQLKEARLLAESNWSPAIGKVIGVGLINVQKPQEVLAFKVLVG